MFLLMTETLYLKSPPWTRSPIPKKQQNLSKSRSSKNKLSWQFSKMSAWMSLLHLQTDPTHEEHGNRIGKHREIFINFLRDFTLCPSNPSHKSPQVGRHLLGKSQLQSPPTFFTRRRRRGGVVPEGGGWKVWRFLGWWLNQPIRNICSWKWLHLPLILGWT